MYLRGGKCEICGSPENLQAHHLHYRYLFSEQSHMDCLQLVCKNCHAAAERKKKFIKKRRWSIFR